MIWLSRLSSPLARIWVGGYLPAAVPLTVQRAPVRMHVCSEVLISTSNGSACRLMRLRPPSSISCAPSASAPMISPLRRSRWLSVALWSHAIRLIFSVFPVSCWRIGRNRKPYPHIDRGAALQQPEWEPGPGLLQRGAAARESTAPEEHALNHGGWPQGSRYQYARFQRAMSQGPSSRPRKLWLTADTL